jgi:hypothetical protein
MESIKIKRGRPEGGVNLSNYKWEVCLFDKITNQLKKGKFSTIAELNKDWGLNLNSDYVKRIMTHYRADETMKHKENSFIKKWGHINITKINEKRI